jgi:branched-chain amino acid transport system permease protein
MEFLYASLLVGLSYGMVLFLIAAGLSFMLGLMGIVNLAHGAIFMVGGYIGLTVATTTGNFVLGILAGTLAAAVVGLFIERATLRQLYKQPLEQILVTFGFVYVITNITLWIWGPYPKIGFTPSILDGSITIGESSFPVYRLAIIVIGLAVYFLLWWLQSRTKIGAIVRAGMDDAPMTSALGKNLSPVTIGAFVFGSAIAGFAGFVGIAALGSIDVGTGSRIIFLALGVCIVGGVGSVHGALVGALLIGIVESLIGFYFPEVALFTMYILMIIILLFKPSGLLGREI